MGRKISIAAIREVHEEHGRWRITGGREGRCANLWGPKLRGANLKDAVLRGALDLTIEQLSEAKTLYKSKLDLELMEQVKEKYPHLLEKPKST